MSANLLASGRVGVASSDDNVGINLNPGSLGLRERYDFAGFFGYGPYGGLSWGANVVDARTSDYVAAGFSYSGDRQDPPLAIGDLPGWKRPHEQLTNVRHHHDFTGAVAVPLAHRRISFGLGVDVARFDQEHAESGTMVDGHVGLGVRPIDAFEFGLVGRNLLPSTDPLDRPPEVRSGARLIGKDVGWLEFDGGWRRGDSSPLLAAGGELQANKARLWAGWHLENSVQSLSTGIGYADTGGSIEYGIQVPLGSAFSAGAIVQEVSVRFSAPASLSVDD